MNSTLMRKSQRSSDSIWSLPAGTSTKLHVGPGPRVLRVCEGRLWLTTAGTADDAATDLWLEPGDEVDLASGLEVVMEAWPAARYQLLVPPSACSGRLAETTLAARASRWLESRWQGHRVPTMQPG
jgi:hypothetical protein